MGASVFDPVRCFNQVVKYFGLYLVSLGHTRDSVSYCSKMVSMLEKCFVQSETVEGLIKLYCIDPEKVQLISKTAIEERLSRYTPTGDTAQPVDLDELIRMCNKFAEAEGIPLDCIKSLALKKKFVDGLGDVLDSEEPELERISKLCEDDILFIQANVKRMDFSK